MPKCRINICLDEDLWALIKARAKARQSSASEYIGRTLRDAARKEDLEERLRGVQELAELELPVDSWEQMEEELIRSRVTAPGN